MSRKEIIKELKSFLQNNYPNYQAFNTWNIAGDPMITVYDKHGIEVNLCEYWEYLEIFGLTDSEFYNLINEKNNRLKTFRVQENKNE